MFLRSGGAGAPTLSTPMLQRASPSPWLIDIITATEWRWRGGAVLGSNNATSQSVQLDCDQQTAVTRTHTSQYDDRLINWYRTTDCYRWQFRDERDNGRECM